MRSHSLLTCQLLQARNFEPWVLQCVSLCLVVEVSSEKGKEVVHLRLEELEINC
jgi:hypothetical protein